MEAKSTKSITFPKIPWSIAAGEVKKLPESKEDQAIILAWPEITLVMDEEKINGDAIINNKKNK